MKPFTLTPFRRHTLAGLAFLSIASLASAADSSAVIAKVGDTTIKLDEIKPFFAKLSASDRDALTKNPAALNQVVRKLIVQQLLYKEALTAGWEKQPEVIAQLEQLKQGAIAETYIQSIAKVPDTYPTAAEVEATYDAKKATLIVPRQLQLSQIYVPRPSDQDKAAVDKAAARVEVIAKSLKAPNADFVAIAQSVATDPELNGRGGEIGWLTETDIQPEVRSRISGLPKGGLTEVIKLPDGWYILKVQDIKESRPATLDEVRDQIVQALRNERARLNREAYLAKIQQQNPVSINELELSQLINTAKN
jgi:parvulin-like peptidyl-prolyl isomerase